MLTPWLIYWTILSLFLLVEAQLYFILSYIPFYAWIRFGAHLYLVLPGKQGSVYLYKQYLEPFLEEHERQIDRMISEGHEKAKAAGLDAVKKVIEYVRVQVLGLQPKQASPAPSRNVSYSTYLMDRFAMPSARQGLAAAGTSDIFGLIGKALQQTTYPDSTTREAKVEDLTQSGTLIPPNLAGAERADFISTQRERLRTLLQAFDYEAYRTADNAATSSIRPPRSSMPRQPSGRKSYPYPDDNAPMHKSRSESEFEDLAYEAMPDPDDYVVKSPTGPSSPSEKGKQKAAAGGGGWGTWMYVYHESARL